MKTISEKEKLSNFERVSFDELRKKTSQIGVRFTDLERELITDFCEKNSITISNFFRYAIFQTINNLTKK